MENKENKATNHAEFYQSLKYGLQQCILPNYVYTYPSKRTYRHFSTPVKISEIWQENKDYLNIYLHIPFCIYRCGYCTLFLTNKFTAELLDQYTQKLCEQIIYYGKYTNHRTVTSIYFGGGTPTILSAKQLEKIFMTLYKTFPNILSTAEINIESTPERISQERLEQLKNFGINRISIGAQTLQPQELKLLDRHHTVEDTLNALELINLTSLNLNVDLIYGLPGQTQDSWNKTLIQILTFKPDILSLYPILVRPLTKIQKLKNDRIDTFMNDHEKYNLYDENVRLLQQHEYQQSSFNRFSRLGADSYLQEALDFQGVPLLGLGAGARSYKDQYHYSTDYTVTSCETRKIIEQFSQQQFNDDYVTNYGIILNLDEIKRRYIMLNLTLGKIITKNYMTKFKCLLMDDFGTELKILYDNHCIDINTNNDINLTPLGFKFSHLIATLFYSQEMRQLEENFQSK